jgi:hypothetical protein
VDGAVVLMEKIGHLLDTKLQNIEASAKETPEKPLKQLDVETAEKIRKTFARF